MKFEGVNPNLIAAIGVILAFVALMVVMIWQSNRSDANIADLRSEMETRFERMETRFERIETRLDRIETQIDSVREDLGTRVSAIELENARLSERSEIMVGMHGGSHPHQLEPDQP